MVPDCDYIESNRQKVFFLDESPSVDQSWVMILPRNFSFYVTKLEKAERISIEAFCALYLVLLLFRW